MNLDWTLIAEDWRWLYGASTWVLPVLLAVTFHEAAHGYAARALGDDTAERAGRLTLNPIRHIDPFGTVLLPIMLIVIRAPFLIGWARPVPVAFSRLRKPRRDMVLVSLAGPGANIFLAILAAIAGGIVPLLGYPVGQWVQITLDKMLILNCLLAVFNLLPIPPLDGGRVVTGLLPLPLARRFARLERWGMLLIIGVLVGLPLLAQATGRPAPELTRVIVAPTLWLVRFIRLVFGLG